MGKEETYKEHLEKEEGVSDPFIPAPKRRQGEGRPDETKHVGREHGSGRSADDEEGRKSA